MSPESEPAAWWTTWWTEPRRPIRWTAIDHRADQLRRRRALRRLALLVVVTVLACALAIGTAGPRGRTLVDRLLNMPTTTTP